MTDEEFIGDKEDRYSSYINWKNKKVKADLQAKFHKDFYADAFPDPEEHAEWIIDFAKTQIRKGRVTATYLKAKKNKFKGEVERNRKEIYG